MKKNVNYAIKQINQMALECLNVIDGFSGKYDAERPSLDYNYSQFYAYCDALAVLRNTDQMHEVNRVRRAYKMKIKRGAY